MVSFLLSSKRIYCVAYNTLPLEYLHEPVLYTRDLMLETNCLRVAVFRVRVMTNSPQRHKSARKRLFPPPSLSVIQVNKTRIVRPVAALAPDVRAWRSR